MITDVEPDIRAVYASRLAAREREAARLALRDALVARARLGVFVIGAILVWQATAGRLAGWWLVVPVVAFVVLVLVHQRTRAALALVRRSVEFYVRGLARIDERWIGSGITGDRFHDPNHPYVEDLDLFGRGSLFELLCTCRTRPGEERLAAWLAAPAAPRRDPRAPSDRGRARTRDRPP